VKKLGKIRPGGGWRMLGRSEDTRRGRYQGKVGYDYLHVAIDDHSRCAYVEALADEKGVTCAGFVLRAAAHLAGLGIRIERVMTDRALNYTLSPDFAAAWRRSAPDIGPPGLTARRATARRSGSTERCSMSRPTRASAARTRRGSPPCLDGSTSTIVDVPTPRSEGSADLTALNNVSGNYS
jgi:Integrase core domain